MNERLDTLVRAALEDIVAAAPPSETWPDIELDSTSNDQARGPQRRRALAAAAAVAVAGFGATLWALDRPAGRTSETPATTPATAAPPPPSPTAPVLLDTAPIIIADSPTRFPALPAGDPRNDEARASLLGVSRENVRQTSAFVGRVQGDRLVDTVQITGYATIAEDTFPEATIRSEVIGGASVIVYTTPGTPPHSTVVVDGPAPIGYHGDAAPALLAAGGTDIARARRVLTADGDEAVELTIGELPAGYEVLTEPAPLPIGNLDPQLVIGDTEAASVIIEVTSTPTLRSPATAIDINGTRGWISNGESPDIVWEPEPGVHLTVGAAPSTEVAVEIARAVELVDVTTWQARYAIAEEMVAAEQPRLTEAEVIARLCSMTSPDALAPSQLDDLTAYVESLDSTNIQQLAETCSPGQLTEAQLDALSAYLSTL